MEYDEHDPWNEPSHRHPRASELMCDDDFWDCVNELAPFGSDEGAEAYVEYRRWREENPESRLVECLAWILGGRISDFDSDLLSDASIRERNESAVRLGYPDAFTLDATIIATVLGQLVDEGSIDEEAKPFAFIAIDRQSHPCVLSTFNDEDTAVERREMLKKVRHVIELA